MVSTANETRKIINPFNQEIIAEVAEGNDADAKKAIQAARTAFDEGNWPNTPATERGKLVRQIATLIERDKEELARLESLDTGKTRSEEHTSELQSRGHIVCRLLLEKKNNNANK